MFLGEEGAFWAGLGGVQIRSINAGVEIGDDDGAPFSRRHDAVLVVRLLPIGKPHTHSKLKIFICYCPSRTT